MTISLLSHILRLYTTTYTSFTNATDCQSKMNKVYGNILNANEIKLLRYCHVTDQLTYQNEVLTLGGKALMSPLQPSYTLFFGSGLAVQLNNLQFNVTKVSNQV